MLGVIVNMLAAIVGAVLVGTGIGIVFKAGSTTGGIDIIIKPGTKNESVHIPVILSKSGITESGRFLEDEIIRRDEDSEGFDILDVLVSRLVEVKAILGQPHHREVIKPCLFHHRGNNINLADFLHLC